MKELSLNILDIAQNSITAGAQNIEISVCEYEDTLIIAISDDGCGMTSEFVARVTDPFTTTRTTRKVGMGIPLFKMAAEQTGGSFTIESEPGVGTKVKADFQRNHIDLPPMGNLAETMVTLIQGWPMLNFTLIRRRDEKEYYLKTDELREITGDVALSEPQVLEWINGFIQENEQALLM